MNEEGTPVKKKGLPVYSVLPKDDFEITQDSQGPTVDVAEVTIPISGKQTVHTPFIYSS